MATSERDGAPKRRRKILVFTSRGGHGHVSAARAMEQFLGENHEVVVADTFQGVLRSLDLIDKITRGRISGEEFYNFLLRRHWLRAANAYCRIGGWTFRRIPRTLERALDHFIDEQQPDLIVSVIPLINFAFLEIAQKRGVPFLIVPTDLDLRYFLNGIDSPDYEKFHLALPYDDEEIHRSTVEAGIPAHQIEVTGFPIREQFLEQPDRDMARIRQRFGVPEGRKVVMLLMGGVGSVATLQFVERIRRHSLGFPVHLLVCLGQQRQMAPRLEEAAARGNGSLSLSTIGFTDEIAELMAISDLLITKPGTCSVNEALYMGTPMLIDARRTLRWEKMNIDFVAKHRMGEALTGLDRLDPLLQQYLTGDASGSSTLETPDFRNRIRDLTARILPVAS